MGNVSSRPDDGAALYLSDQNRCESRLCPCCLRSCPMRSALTASQPAVALPVASTLSIEAPSKRDANVHTPGANPEKPSTALPHVPAGKEPHPAVPSRDDTLKPSDRRFFLQSSESPDRPSPEGLPQQPQAAPSKGTGAGNVGSSGAPEPSPTDSATSSNMRSDAPAPQQPPRRNLSKPNVRRGKEISRLTAVRSNARAQAQRQAIQRRATTEPKKTTFNIGSVSSNGTSRDGRSNKASPPRQNQAVAKPRPPSPLKLAEPVRKGLVVSTSSEYTTDSDEDSEWASEDNSTNSADEREQERQREETRIREAAEEVRRQRDMFVKAPKRSYSNLNRTKSGLLSQLLNPDPNIFPPNHPYRTSYSSQDVTQLARQGGRLLPLNGLSSRSSAAIPLATQITPMTAQAQVSPATTVNAVNESYRPRGRPQGAEMEDDSDSESDRDNGIQLSHSLAQQRLAAIASGSRRRASGQSPLASTTHTALPAPPVPAQTPAPASTKVSAPTQGSQEEQQTRPSGLTQVATAPIPLGHPYNLPAPAPPMTPRTTRRQMLSTELSESLRRNLLWERQVTKINMLGGARRGGLQPMTAADGGDPAYEERERLRRAQLARNRSLGDVDDYHRAGW